mmetsp:Transcript_11093/g.32888  ORF Transcript_11093/g.32888 Transcript_11093/m.32888 type:complete len:250 (-) Transcript_11093:19-768(-)
MQPEKSKVLAVFFSRGGLGDVGRHAVQAALDLGPEKVSKIIVISPDPSTLEEDQWACGCVDVHRFTNEERKRLEVIKKDVTKVDLTSVLRGADAIVSCLGNRQFFLGSETRVGKKGTESIVKSCQELGIERVVAMSSVGIDDDWPPAEFHWAGNIMSCLFLTCSRREFKDLTGVDRSIRTSDLDYLLVRPLGLGEDVVPVNQWFLQEKKGVDGVGINMAKLDCARFMLKEALNPTLHCTAAVVGSKPEK